MRGPIQKDLYERTYTKEPVWENLYGRTCERVPIQKDLWDRICVSMSTYESTCTRTYVRRPTRGSMQNYLYENTYTRGPIRGNDSARQEYLSGVYSLPWINRGCSVERSPSPPPPILPGRDFPISLLLLFSSFFYFLSSFESVSLQRLEVAFRRWLTSDCCASAAFSHTFIVKPCLQDSDAVWSEEEGVEE